MEELARGDFSTVSPGVAPPEAEAPLVLERSHPWFTGDEAVLAGLEADARRLAALPPLYRAVVEVTRPPWGVEVLRERFVGLTGVELLRGLGAEGRLLPLPAWLRLALELTGVPEGASCGPAAGGGLDSLGVDLARRLRLFPHPDLALAGPHLWTLLPPAPRLRRLADAGSMSPEQVKGEPHLAASSVFSTAWVLAELLTGVSPFLRASFHETLFAVAQGQAHWEASDRPGCPASLGAVLRRALLPEPERRWPDLRTFGAALLDAAGCAAATGLELAHAWLAADPSRLRARLRSLQAAPGSLPLAWRGEGLQVLEDGLLEALPGLEGFPRRVGT
jgi:hypothetical protein